MHLVVCAKQIPDPETPPAAFRVDEANNEVIPAQGIPPVLSQFDGMAAEAALRIIEAAGEGKITVISLGQESAQAAIKQVLAMGADEGILLEDEVLQGGDSYTTARTLAAVIEHLGDVDAVFCGRQAADWDMGQVGLGVAELLGWPSAIIGKDAKVEDGSMVVERVTGEGFETVSMPMPAVVTISNEIGDPRYPKLQQIMQAARKTVTRLTADELGLDPSTVGDAGARLKLERLFIPVVEGEVELMEGETAEEQAQALAAALREAKIL